MGEPTSTPAPACTCEPPSAILRALVGVVRDASDPGGSLATATHLLAQATPDSERTALRLIAVWLMSDPTAARRLRQAGLVRSADAAAAATTATAAAT